MNKWLIALLAAVAAGVIAWVMDTQVINPYKQKYDAVYTVRFQPKDSSNAAEDLTKTIEQLKELFAEIKLKSTITPVPGNPSLYRITAHGVPDSTFLNRVLSADFGIKFQEVYQPVLPIPEAILAARCEVFPKDCLSGSQTDDSSSTTGDTSATARMIAEINGYEKNKQDEKRASETTRPLFDMPMSPFQVLVADEKDTATIGTILRHPKVAGLLPAGVRAYFSKVQGAGRKSRNNNEFALYLLSDRYRDGSPMITGNHVESAKKTNVSDGMGGDAEVIMLSFTEEGRRRWQQLTTRNVRREIAIVAGGQLISAPLVQSVMTGRDIQISNGSMGPGELEDLLPVFGMPIPELSHTPVIESSQLTVAPAGSKFPLIPLSVFVLVFAATMLVFKTLKSTRPAPVSGEKRA